MKTRDVTVSDHSRRDRTHRKVCSSVSDTAHKLIEWLVGDDCHALDDTEMPNAFGKRLRAVGLPIDRLTLHLRSLHPLLLGRSYAWAPNEAIEVHDRKFGAETALEFARSPFRKVMESGRSVRVRLSRSSNPDWTKSDLFRGRNLSEIIAVPLRTTDGLNSAACFGTSRRGGFTNSHWSTLSRLVPALRSACEIRLLRRTELSLLDTYVGSKTAQHVMAGRVRRGDFQILQAALLLCDLRDFTGISNRLTMRGVVNLLDTYFDCIVPAVTRAGGEVVKYMGDAALVFFNDGSPVVSCRAALQGALDAHARLKSTGLQAGIALHYGEIGYGNIGAVERLDFTVVGPDVNMVSRIQNVCSRTGHPLLMSHEFAKLVGSELPVSTGYYRLSGFVETVELYALTTTFRSNLAFRE